MLADAKKRDSALQGTPLRLDIICHIFHFLNQI